MGSRWQEHHDAEELRLYRREVPWPRFIHAAPAYLIVGALFVLMVVIGLHEIR